MAKRYKAVKHETESEAAEPIERADGPTSVDEQTAFTAYPNEHGGGFHYYDQAGRIFKGYQSEDAAQAAAESHTPIENDPTLDAEA